MTLTLLFTINIPSYKGLHDCVKEVKNLEQLKEREETEIAFVEGRHFLVLHRGRKLISQK
jgi:hypothetical protein